jgi:hypothetical protein
MRDGEKDLGQLHRIWKVSVGVCLQGVLAYGVTGSRYPFCTQALIQTFYTVLMGFVFSDSESDANPVS